MISGPTLEVYSPFLTMRTIAALCVYVCMCVPAASDAWLLSAASAGTADGAGTYLEGLLGDTFSFGLRWDTDTYPLSPMFSAGSTPPGAPGTFPSPGI